MDNTSVPKADRKRSSSSATFVWAKDGNHEGAKEHAAYLLQTSDVPSTQLVVAEDDGEEYVYVRWCSTGTISRIPKSNISTEELSTRRCRRAAVADVVATTQKAPKSKKSRLSLSKKQRQHWRDQQQKDGRNKEDREKTNCQDNQVQKRYNSSNDNDDNDNAGEEKKDDDVTIQSSKSISALPCNPLLVQEERKYQQQSKKNDEQYSNSTTTLPSSPLMQKRDLSKNPQPQQQKVSKQKAAAAMQSTATISTLPCNPLAQEKDVSIEAKPQAEQQKATAGHSYTYRSSAYVQHLAEACNIIMSDARWRTVKQSGNSTREVSLFSWEEGDDLSAVKAFMSLYEDSTNEETAKQNNIVDDIVFERAMNLYSRIYHRKGPWLDLADLYIRYYAPKVSDNTDLETERSKLSFSNHQAALQSLFIDVIRLESMGLVRSFESEFECGTVAGQVTSSQSGGGGLKRGVLLSAEERREVLRMLGGGKSPKAAAAAAAVKQSDSTNEVLAQMQSQKTLLSAFASTKSKTTSLLPVRKHVDKVLLRKLASKVVSLSKSKEGQVYAPKKTEVDMALKMIESEWKDATKSSPMQQHQSSLLSTIRLREAPLQTLRRVQRLFLCAGGGPGAMRGDGTNGWRSCLSEGDWHKVEYPGLNSRFGLEAYPLQKYFAAVVPEHISFSRVFQTLNEFRLFEIGAELRSSIDRSIEAYETERMIRRKNEKSAISIDEERHCIASTADVFHLLTKDGRCKFVRKVLACLNDPNNELEILALCGKIESDVQQLNTITESVTEQESVILITSIICKWLLRFRRGSPLSSSLCFRPWLRHLSFDAILTYITWDAVPFLEKRDMYVMASSSLMVILFGTELQSIGTGVPDNLSNQFQSCQYMQYLLPRRNRGKAIERLIIDLTHAYRKAQKKEASNKSTTLDLSPIQGFCRLLLETTSASCSIPFSSIRNLARRLKSPLTKTMDGLSNDEIELLQIRLDNVSSSDEIESCSGYRDWSPITDVAVANAISNDRDELQGKRCAFVGWESNDHDNRPAATRSLNVEELALELYHSGVLPNTNDKKSSSIAPKGNWEGWHNEGGHVRKLFRIIFLQAVLEITSVDDPTIFLTPYQHSPHDLHVGYQKVESENHNKFSLINGFYERRRDDIETYLSKLSKQTDQSLCDIVYDSIKVRWDSHASDESRMKDVPLLRDAAELKTLSMIAAGLGGQALSSLFRALAFDYRHYSGGLPDLLLARARYLQTCKSGDNEDPQFVDLGEWIGEAFCKEHIEEENLNRSISMLSDKDDDFLGCSKNVDSGSNNKFSSKKKRQKILVLPTFPSKLQLVHDEKQVAVDCMFVEVKSANDRLDARQEDWLNIIDKFAGARVCKFGSKKQSK